MLRPEACSGFTRSNGPQLVAQFRRLIGFLPPGCLTVAVSGMLEFHLFER